MNNSDNIIGILKIWVKWRRTITYICLLTGIVAALTSWFLLKNYYKSTTIFYAASTDLQKPDKVFGVSSEVMRYYGDPDDVNRILSIAESAELREYLTKKFNLYTRYEFDSTTVKSRHDFNEHFKELYNVEKNKLDAIELSIEDTDPEFAKTITLAARDFIDQRAKQIIKTNQANMMGAFEESIKRQQKELQQLDDSLKVLRSNYGIYNTETQSKIITDLSSIAQARLARVSAQVKALEKEPNANQDTIIMMRSLAKGLQNELSVLTNSNANAFNKGMSRVEVLTQVHLQKSKQLGYDVVRYEQLRASEKSDVSSIYVVEQPTVPLIKSRPKRSLIVLAAVFATFVFMTLGIIALESYRKIDWNALKND